MNKYERAIEILRKYNQHHIIKLLEKDKSEDLIEEILSIDFEKIMSLYEDTKREDQKKPKNLEPIQYINKHQIDEQEKRRLKEIGDKVISQGKYAIVTMAGGQGTRLGFEGPKGKYLINVLPKPKYLFEIVCDKLKQANEQYGTTIFWYIMTSKENSKETIDFFKEQEYFGYPKNHVMFFEQSQMPVIDKNGKFLINENHKIKQASDGNGQIFKAMKEHLVLQHMKENSIEWIFIHNIDNILTQVADNVFIGFTINEGSAIGGKTTAKQLPEERVGIYCKINGKIGIAEYTELPIELANLRDQKGALVYNQSNISNMLFNIELLNTLASQQLPYHVAFKANSYMNEQGTIIKPTEPNAYKFESFIFDGFQICNKISLLQCKREEEFAPVKNATGPDSPETATKLYNDYYGKE